MSLPQAAAVFTPAISTSRPYPPCSIAWRIGTVTSSSICRFRCIRGQFRCLRRQRGFSSPELNTIPGFRQIEETLRALRTEALVTTDKLAVVNRCDFGFFGKVARADHVARILGDEKRLFVRDARVALECVNLGTPMTIAYPSDKAVKDIAAIADYCVALKSAAPGRV